MRGEALKGHLDLLVLSVLRKGGAHGYAVIEELRKRSGGVFQLPEGTIYPVLHRLELAGLVRSRWTIVRNRKRRIYELTGRGAEARAARQQEWNRFAEAVGSVLHHRT